MPKSFSIGQVVQVIKKPGFLDKQTGETGPPGYELQVMECDRRLDGQDSFNIVRISSKVDYSHLVGQQIKTEVIPWAMNGKTGWTIPKDVTPQARSAE